MNNQISTELLLSMQVFRFPRTQASSSAVIHVHVFVWGCADPCVGGTPDMRNSSCTRSDSVFSHVIDDDLQHPQNLQR